MASIDQAIAQAEPDQDVAAKSLDDRDTLPRLPNIARMCCQGSVADIRLPFVRQ